MREITDLKQALTLLDEWISAYHELERSHNLLNAEWVKRYAELEREVWRLAGVEYDLAAQQAAERLANEALAQAMEP